MELCVDLRSLADFQAFISGYHTVHSPDDVDQIGHCIMATGCREPLTGCKFLPFELQQGSSWREGLAFDGISSRMRAVMRCIEQAIQEQPLASPRIYAAEGLTAFALRLRSLFPRFLGSEFTNSPEKLQWLYPIPCEDL